MPLGIITEEDYQKEKDNLNKVEVKEPQSASITPIEKGRRQGSTEVPNSIRKLIGETAIESGSSAANSIANFLGISKSSTSAYAKGSTSTSSYNEPKLDLTTHLNNKKLKISKKASHKLVEALDKIDDDKLSDLDAKELASVAKDMSVIIRNFEPEDPKTKQTNSPTIVFYAPKLISEEKFDVITVNE